MLSLLFLLQSSSKSSIFQVVKACILSNEDKAFCTMAASVLILPFPSQVLHKTPLLQQVSRGNFQPTMHLPRFKALLTGRIAQKSPGQQLLFFANLFSLLILLISY